MFIFVSLLDTYFASFRHTASHSVYILTECFCMSWVAWEWSGLKCRRHRNGRVNNCPLTSADHDTWVRGYNLYMFVYMFFCVSITVSEYGGESSYRIRDTTLTNESARLESKLQQATEPFIVFVTMAWLLMQLCTTWPWFWVIIFIILVSTSVVHGINIDNDIVIIFLLNYLFSSLHKNQHSFDLSCAPWSDISRMVAA
jgi:hypothetical protein